MLGYLVVKIDQNSYILFEHHFGAILRRFGLQLGPQLGPKIVPKSIQEPSKIAPKSHLIFDRFFDRFLIDFWSIFGPKIDQKSTKNRSTNHPSSTTTKNQKSAKSVIRMALLALRPCYVAYKNQ